MHKKSQKRFFPVIPVKAEQAVKLQRYPVFSVGSGCRIKSGMTVEKLFVEIFMDLADCCSFPIGSLVTATKNSAVEPMLCRRATIKLHAKYQEIMSCMPNISKSNSVTWSMGSGRNDKPHLSSLRGSSFFVKKICFHEAICKRLRNDYHTEISIWRIEPSGQARLRP